MVRRRMTAIFRELIEKSPLIVAPGAYDSLSAKIIESLGYKAVYVTGYGVEASLLGRPDMGFTSMAELVNHGHRIASAVDIPVIHDSEAGFGNAIIITRTIEEWISAGVAGVHIEDQLTQRKQCPIWETLGGQPKTPMPMETFVGKIKAAVAVRDEIDPDFVIIARTDSDNIGYDEVVKRSNAYLDAGADMAMPILGGLLKGKSIKECIDIYRCIVKDIKGPVFGLGFEDQGLTVKDIEKMGYKLYATPLMAMMAAERAIRDVVLEMREKGTPRGYWDKFPPLTLREHWEMLGLKKFLEIEKKYLISD